MNATILVAPSPYHARVAPRGTFRIRDVPEGSYRLVVWSVRLPPASREVTVRSGEVSSVSLTVGER